MRYTNGFDAQEHLRPLVDGDLADAFVELGPWHCTAGGRERRAGPLDLHVGPEARHPQPATADLPVQPRAEAEKLQFGDGARGETVATRLVPWELLTVDHQHVTAVADRP